MVFCFLGFLLPLGSCAGFCGHSLRLCCVVVFCILGVLLSSGFCAGFCAGFCGPIECYAVVKGQQKSSIVLVWVWFCFFQLIVLAKLQPEPRAVTLDELRHLGQYYCSTVCVVVLNAGGSTVCICVLVLTTVEKSATWMRSWFRCHCACVCVCVW